MTDPKDRPEDLIREALADCVGESMLVGSALVALNILVEERDALEGEADFAASRLNELDARLYRAEAALREIMRNAHGGYLMGGSYVNPCGCDRIAHAAIERETND